MQRTNFLRDPEVVGNPRLHYLTFALYLFVFWLLITANLEPKFLIMGLSSSIVVTWLCMPLFMLHNQSHTKKYFMLGFSPLKLLLYTLWLMKELILANIDVAKAALKKELPIQPQILHVQCHYDNPLALTLLANSITLTPGTITVNVSHGNVYTIHALTPGAAQGIIDGSMLKKVAELLNDSPEYEMLTEEETWGTAQGKITGGDQ